MARSSRSNRVNVSSLKAKLSAYLRRARRGEELVVLAGNLPIAKLVAIDAASTENPAFIPPEDPDTHLASVRGHRLASGKTDVVSLLMQDRDGR